MRGYWAQIWRSVLAWMELGETERLYLEGAEDIWLAELKSPTPDWIACRESFQRAYEFGRRYGLPGFAQAAAREIARITDENMHDLDEALRVAERMAGEIGSSPSQDDGRATILLRKRDDRAALEIWRKLLPTWTPRDEFDLQQTFSHRRAAIAAARLGEWTEAAGWLHAAWGLAADDQAIYRAALLIDEGITWWKAGDNPQALARLVEGLAAIERLPSDDVDEGAYTLRKRAGHTVMWMAHTTAGSPPVDFSEPSPAYCSSLEAFQAARLPSTPLDVMRGHLLEFEFYAGLGDRNFLIHEESLAESPYGLVRFSLDRLRLQHRLKSLALDDLVEVLAHYAESLELCRLYYREGGLGPADQLPANATAIAPEQYSTEFL
jgi:tetratricopeptide (TPR) repeat protein